MRGRVGGLILLAVGVMASTSGCVVAETLVLTTHMRHEAGLRTEEPGEIRGKEPRRRTPLDVPAEPTPPTP